MFLLLQSGTLVQCTDQINKYRLLFYQRKPLLPLCCQWWCTAAVLVCTECLRSFLRYISYSYFYAFGSRQRFSIGYPFFDTAALTNLTKSVVSTPTTLSGLYFWVYLVRLQIILLYAVVSSSCPILLLLEPSLELSFSTELKTLSNKIFYKSDGKCRLTLKCGEQSSYLSSVIFVVARNPL